MTQSSWMTDAKVFLCGPMSGLPDYNYPLFHDVTYKLREQGYLVENPAENAATIRPGDLHKATYMRMSIAQLLGTDRILGNAIVSSPMCEMVVVLPGWQDSLGAMAEVSLAWAIGLPVVDADTLLGGDPIDIELSKINNSYAPVIAQSAGALLPCACEDCEADAEEDAISNKIKKLRKKFRKLRAKRLV